MSQLPDVYENDSDHEVASVSCKRNREMDCDLVFTYRTGRAARHTAIFAAFGLIFVSGFIKSISKYSSVSSASTAPRPGAIVFYSAASLLAIFATFFFVMRWINERVEIKSGVLTWRSWTGRRKLNVALTGILPGTMRLGWGGRSASTGSSWAIVATSIETTDGRLKWDSTISNCKQLHSLMYAYHLDIKKTE